MAGFSSLATSFSNGGANFRFVDLLADLLLPGVSAGGSRWCFGVASPPCSESHFPRPLLDYRRVSTRVCRRFWASYSRDLVLRTAFSLLLVASVHPERVVSGVGVLS